MTAMRIAISVLAAAALVAACSSQAAAPGGGGPASLGGATASSTVTAATPSAPGTRLRPVRLVVPAGEGGAPFTTPRTLRVPSGWTARVWARVPDARMEAWTPEGDLLVSQPYNGIVTELVPDSRGT